MEKVYLTVAAHLKLHGMFERESVGIFFRILIIGRKFGILGAKFLCSGSFLV
jgi:hypothetical protein